MALFNERPTVYELIAWCLLLIRNASRYIHAFLFPVKMFCSYNNMGECSKILRMLWSMLVLLKVHVHVIKLEYM